MSTFFDDRVPRFTRRRAVQVGSVTPLLAVAVASGTPVATAQDQPGVSPDRVTSAVSALPGIVRDLMDRTGVPGMAVAVVYGDEVLVATGYGVCDAAAGEPVDADTVFQIASLSKPVSTTVVAALVGEGVVAWDTRMAEIDPGFALSDPWVTANVTLEDLFSHRSGLPDHAGDTLEDLGGDRDAVLHSLRYIQPHGPFRSSYAYTNAGFTAAAIAAASEVGMEWEDVAAVKLFEPAGMTRTTMRNSEFVAMDNRAVGHVLQGDTWVHAFDRQPDVQSPAGGVSSSVNDLARWMRVQLNAGSIDGEQIIPATALEGAHVPHVVFPSDHPSTEPASFYGLGWNVSYDGGDIVLSHSGAFAYGAATTVRLLPKDGLGIVVLTNAAPIGVAESASLAFMDLCQTGEVSMDYLEVLRPYLEAAAKPLYGDVVAQPPAVVEPPSSQETYLGTFDNLVFGVLEVVADGENLEIVLGPNDSRFPLTHYSRDVFTYFPTGENAELDSAVTFVVDATGRASQVVLENLDLYGAGTFVRRQG